MNNERRDYADTPSRVYEKEENLGFRKWKKVSKQIQVQEKEKEEENLRFKKRKKN